MSEKNRIMSFPTHEERKVKDAIDRLRESLIFQGAEDLSRYDEIAEKRFTRVEPVHAAVAVPCLKDFEAKVFVRLYAFTVELIGLEMQVAFLGVSCEPLRPKATRRHTGGNRSIG